MPVANLQAYTTVALRVRSSAFAAQGAAVSLEQQVLASLKAKCGFQQVPSGTAADVILDLNITNSGRGGGGFISNDNVATVDALLVLTDGIDGGLLGTATIHGKSGGMIINNGDPATDATGAMAQSVGDLLAKSGCSGPRVARAEPEVTPPIVGSAAPDESRRPEAERLNDAGKEKLYAADLPGALALFQQAMAMLPDAKYEFNGCLTLGAQERWDAAIQSCKKARSLNPSVALGAKIDKRLEILAQHQ